jgi:hypothetical protein
MGGTMSQMTVPCSPQLKSYTPHQQLQQLMTTWACKGQTDTQLAVQSLLAPYATQQHQHQQHCATSSCKLLLFLPTSASAQVGLKQQLSAVAMLPCGQTYSQAQHIPRTQCKKGRAVFEPGCYSCCSAGLQRITLPDAMQQVAAAAGQALDRPADSDAFDDLIRTVDNVLSRECRDCPRCLAHQYLPACLPMLCLAS